MQRPGAVQQAPRLSLARSPCPLSSIVFCKNDISSMFLACLLVFPVHFYWGSAKDSQFFCQPIPRVEMIFPPVFPVGFKGDRVHCWIIFIFSQGAQANGAYQRVGLHEILPDSLLRGQFL